MWVVTRGPNRTTRAETAVLVAGLVVAGIFVWAAVLAATHRPIPVALWIFIGTITAAGFVVVVLSGGSRGGSVEGFRHSTGEFVLLQDYKERRRRGTRAALDWKYSIRTYLFVPFGFAMGSFGGLDLLDKEPLWQQVGGALLIVATLVAGAALVRWLLLPVDPQSRARLDAYYEEMRWDWGALNRHLRSRRERRRTR